MKITAASNNGVMLTGHIGRCSMFLIYDIQENRITGIERRDNVNYQHEHRHEHRHSQQHEHKDNLNHGLSGHENEHHCCHDGGEGKVNAARNPRHENVLNTLKDCKFVICNSAGRGMINDLEENKISVILTLETDAKKAVEKFIAGDLRNDPSIKCIEHKD